MIALFDRVKSRFYTEFEVPAEDDPEHPYEYVERVYGHTPNSKVSGLPGYTPPTPIRLLNGVAYYLSLLVTASSIGFVFLLTTLGLAYSIESVSNITFTSPIHIPLTGQSLLTLEDFTLIMTPLLLGFLTVYIICMLAFLTQYLSGKFSAPYEETYEAWLEEVRPTNSANYPLALHAVYSDSFSRPDPSVAPRAYRDDRVSELVMLGITGFISSAMLFVLLSLIIHGRVMPVDESIEEIIEDTQEVTKGARRYQNN